MNRAISLASLNSLSLSVITEAEKTGVKDELTEKVKYLIETTTAHGPSHFIKKTRLVFKLIWIFFFIIALGLCFEIVVQNIQQYLAFGVNTLIKVVPKAEIIYPEISICSINPLCGPAAYGYIQDYYFNKYNVTIDNYTQLFNLVESGQISNDNDWLIYQTYDPNFDLSLRKSLGYDFDRMIFGYNFKNSYVDSWRFNYYYHAKYGNCMVFNSGVDTNGTLVDIGLIHHIEYGLDMVLFTGLIESPTSYLYENFYKGVVLLINDQNDRSLDKEGVLVQPGNYVNVILTKTTSASLPPPYSNCYDSNSPQGTSTILTIEMARLDMHYSRYNCMTLCRQKAVIDQLRCYDVRYPRLFNATPCASKSEFDELRDIVFDMSECKSLCPFECTTSIYEWTLSYGMYPSYVGYEWLMYNNYYYYQFLDIFGTTDISFDTLEKTMSKFFIYFDPLSVTEITQTPSLDLIGLIANVGGTLGLFIGLSLLSLVEFVELLYHLIIIFFRWLNKKSFKKTN